MDQGGRPTVFDREVFDEICRRLASGQTLREVCRAKDFPAESTVRGWVIDDREGVSAQFARARRLGFESWMDETVEIADDGSNDWIERKRRDGSTEVVLDREHVERSRLRINQRNWIVARQLRALYGDRAQPKDDPDDQDVKITGGLPPDANG